MNHRIERHVSTLARWSQHIAVLSLQLLLLTLLLHRFATLETPVAMNLFIACMAGGAIAILLAIAAWVQIWRDGSKGAVRSAFAIFLSLIIFAYPAWIIPIILELPLINDVSTDTDRPPTFHTLGAERQPGANPIAYPGPSFAKQQAIAYPDIRPMFLERSNAEAFEFVQEAVRKLKWNIAQQRSPDSEGITGRIEAVDKSLFLGLADDVVIRVTGDSTVARIDVRSASRYGQHDLGRNADRIRSLMAEINNRMVEGDKAAAKKLKARFKAEQKKKKELAEARRKKAARARISTQRARARKKRRQRIIRNQGPYIPF